MYFAVHEKKQKFHKTILTYFVQAMKCTLIFSILFYFFVNLSQNIKLILQPEILKKKKKKNPEVYFIPKLNINGQIP